MQILSLSDEKTTMLQLAVIQSGEGFDSLYSHKEILQVSKAEKAYKC